MRQILLLWKSVIEKKQAKDKKKTIDGSCMTRLLGYVSDRAHAVAGYCVVVIASTSTTDDEIDIGSFDQA
jgi:hypothetical protein